MKFALLGDLHMGVKKDDAWLASKQMEFFKFFHAECKKRKVTQVVQTGDWFDVRNAIQHSTMNRLREEVVPLFQDIGTTHVIVGNHDMHLKHKIVPNSVSELLAKHDKFKVYEKPTTVKIGKLKLDMIPWMCRENTQEIKDFVEKSDSTHCVGHFQLVGFYFYAGLPSDGDKPDFLKKYKQVWTGHFHTQSESGNVKYLGTPYTITMGDANDTRGFWIYDTVTEELEYVENPVMNHVKLAFNADTFDTNVIPMLEDKVVRLVVEKRTSDTRKIDYDLVESKIAEVVADLDVVDTVELEYTTNDDEEIEVENVEHFVGEFLDSFEDMTADNKERIRTIFSTLKREAEDLA